MKINFGDWEGLTIKEIEANFPEKFIEWRNDEINTPMCGGDLSLKIAFNHSFAPTLITLNDTSHLPNNYAIKSYV